jgi:PAS domain S-box-containing protein
MDAAAPRRPSRALGGALVLIAMGATLTYLLLPSDGITLGRVAQVLAAFTAFLSAAVIRSAIRRGASWTGGTPLALAMLLLGVVDLVFLAMDLAGARYAPRAGDTIFLFLLVPLIALARNEFAAHFASPDRREIAADVMLVTVAVTSILFVLIRPDNATPITSVSTAVWAVLAATQLTIFAALFLWVPSRVHALQCLLFATLGVGTAVFGWQWTHGTFTGTSPWVDLPLMLCPIGFAIMATQLPGYQAGEVVRVQPRRWARPVLTSAAVLTACAALALVAILDDSNSVTSVRSTVLIVLLGMAIAARILANQITSSQAHSEVRSALAGKEMALRETDAALERVREANETLRASEEHLRSVFDAAVDGIVELDERGTIVRANEAFAQMAGLDRTQIEGQTWTVLAAAVSGADAAFASLPSAGPAQIKRSEGQPLYLESRVSTIPGNPPRTLMMIRDVTAGRVADQTIRSLFQFLQDRDEDRTRLLRRTNAAIESERNRIARDLHDGPVQGVSAASLSLEAALLMIKAGDTERGLEVLGRIREELALEADALRRLMSGLRPPVLEERGLIPALRETLKKFGEEHHVHTEFSGSVPSDLPDDLETLAYRVVQEALSNAGKHADAVSVLVSVDADDSSMRIEVQDDGAGFESEKAREFLKMGRVGLASMRERVELASGTFVVRSSPGRGTHIMATLPIETVNATPDLVVVDPVA